MLIDRIKNIPIILASQSPRRKELLASLDIDFTVLVRNVDESIPESVPAEEAAEYVCLKKLSAFTEEEFYNKILITADTVVVDAENKTLGKPQSAEEAKAVIKSLSGSKHQVYTGVALRYQHKQRSFTTKTEVSFADLSEEEIDYYIQKYQPFDKAGSYGIQEWIGRIGVKYIHGTFENVMGLPTHHLYRELIEIIK